MQPVAVFGFVWQSRQYRRVLAVVLILTVALASTAFIFLPEFIEAAFPQVLSVTETTDPDRSMDVSMPSAVNEDDLLLIIVYAGGDGADITETPTGWEVITDIGGGEGDRQMRVFARVADGTEGGTTVTVGGDAQTGAMSAQTYRIDDWFGALSQVVKRTSFDTNPPSLEPTWEQKDTLWIAAASASDYSSPAAPSNYSNAAFTDIETAHLGTASRSLNASSEDPGSFTGFNATDELSLTIAIRPAEAQGDFNTVFTGPVWVEDNFYVNGAISKLSGSFVIDHPLDPLKKLLYHSFVESPEPKNIYDGIAKLDGRGEAVVSLPSYFEALNKDYRYLMTPIGAPMPNLHIKGEVANNEFVIGGGIPGGQVSWQVTGVRDDAYMRANPPGVEVSKGPSALVPKGQCLFEPLCR